MPAGQLGAGLLDDPLPDRVDQTCFFSDRDELVRTQRSPLGVFPPDQGLGADDVSVGERDHRLKAQGELIPFNSVVQVRRGRETFL